ncbi:MAG: algL [Hydrocarboniphaga sp.]|uniref:mannuronate-specific alginate lyase n=1 Tax=Hydrocarboniphaga sp. TaxID=2033016 RepID=UPI002601A05A|nr:mannuronate-specific alginate lyase [Hydrocarboniphaga sp.]MDB5970734.1 algL [Hydrocarboniphaga sp.]
MHIRTSTPIIVSGLLLSALGMSASVKAADLVPPPGYYAPVGQQKAKSFSCPAAPEPFAGTLDFPSKYEGSGKARDQLNEAADQKYKALTKPITDMETGATKLVDQYMESGQSEVLQCALDWYGGWARARGLLGPAANHTGASMRKWSLASLSGAWLRLKFSSSKPLASRSAQAAQIDAWLGEVADKVVGEWDLKAPLDKINNHYYWAAWSVMASSVVNNRHDQFDWAVKMYDIFAGQVDAEGYLPNEMKRESRAAGYQVYAVTPVAMIAAFGKANNADLAATGNKALSRAAERALSAYDDPSQYEAKTGKQQTLEGADEQSAKLAWLEPYCWATQCSAATIAKRDQLRPMKNRRLGGDVTAEFRNAS